MGIFLWPHSQQYLTQKELHQDLILSKLCGASGRYARELVLELIPHVRAASMVAKDEDLKQDSILIDACIQSLPSRFQHNPPMLSPAGHNKAKSIFFLPPVCAQKQF